MSGIQMSRIGLPFIFWSSHINFVCAQNDSWIRAHTCKHAVRQAHAHTNTCTHTHKHIHTRAHVHTLVSHMYVICKEKLLEHSPITTRVHYGPSFTHSCHTSVGFQFVSMSEVQTSACQQTNHLPASKPTICLPANQTSACQQTKHLPANRPNICLPADQTSACQQTICFVDPVLWCRVHLKGERTVQWNCEPLLLL